MSLVVVGCNHRSASLDLLERLTVAPDDLPKALHELSLAEHLSESVLVSTCNRVEVYAYAERFHGGYGEIREMLACHSGFAAGNDQRRTLRISRQRSGAASVHRGCRT